MAEAEPTRAERFWLFERVTWKDSQGRKRAGRVTAARMAGEGRSRFLSLTIACDSGFLVYLPADGVKREDKP